MTISKSRIEELVLKASQTADLTEKQLLVAAIVSTLLKPLEITPILVGGAAVQFYTFGKYATFDIDMITPVVLPKELEKQLSKYGFKRVEDLRHWLHPKIDIPIEFPPTPLQIGNLYPDEVNKIKIEGLELSVVTLEDIILDRLIGAQEWKDKSMENQAEALLLTNYKNIKWDYLHSSAAGNNVLKLLQKLQSKVKKIIKEQKLNF